MGGLTWFSLLALCLACVVFNGLTNARSDDTFELYELDENFIKYFVTYLGNSGVFDSRADKELTEISESLIDFAKRLADKHYSSVTGRKAVLVTYASQLAEFVVSEKNGLSLFEKTTAVTDALRYAYQKKGNTPNENFIDQVAFLVGVFYEEEIEEEQISETNYNVETKESKTTKESSSSKSTENTSGSQSQTSSNTKDSSGAKTKTNNTTPIDSAPTGEPEKQYQQEYIYSLNTTESSSDREVESNRVTNVLKVIARNGSKHLPTLVAAILRTKGTSSRTLNFKVFINELGVVLSHFKQHGNGLNSIEIFLQLVIETLISALEIIRVSDYECLRDSVAMGGISRYVNAFNYIAK